MPVGIRTYAIRLIPPANPPCIAAPAFERLARVSDLPGLLRRDLPRIPRGSVGASHDNLIRGRSRATFRLPRNPRKTRRWSIDAQRIGQILDTQVGRGKL